MVRAKCPLMEDCFGPMNHFLKNTRVGKDGCAIPAALIYLLTSVTLVRGI